MCKSFGISERLFCPTCRNGKAHPVCLPHGAWLLCGVVSLRTATCLMPASGLDCHTFTVCSDLQVELRTRGKQFIIICLQQ